MIFNCKLIFLACCVGVSLSEVTYKHRETGATYNVKRCERLKGVPRGTPAQVRCMKNEAVVRHWPRHVDMDIADTGSTDEHLCRKQRGICEARLDLMTDITPGCKEIYNGCKDALRHLHEMMFKEDETKQQCNNFALKSVRGFFHDKMSNKIEGSILSENHVKMNMGLCRWSQYINVLSDKTGCDAGSIIVMAGQLGYQACGAQIWEDDTAVKPFVELNRGFKCAANPSSRLSRSDGQRRPEFNDVIVSSSSRHMENFWYATNPSHPKPDGEAEYSGEATAAAHIFGRVTCPVEGKLPNGAQPSIKPGFFHRGGTTTGMAQLRERFDEGYKRFAATQCNGNERTGFKPTGAVRVGAGEGETNLNTVGGLCGMPTQFLETVRVGARHRTPRFLAIASDDVFEERTAWQKERCTSRMKMYIPWELKFGGPDGKGIRHAKLPTSRALNRFLAIAWHGVGTINSAWDSCTVGCNIAVSDNRICGGPGLQDFHWAEQPVLRFGARVVLASDAVTGGPPVSSRTKTCGWYGCRVTNVYKGEAKVQHGGDTPKAFTLEPPVVGGHVVGGHNTCAKLPISMNGAKHPRGCPGAVWSGGQPSERYCNGDHRKAGDGKFGWWSKCCKWDGGQCVSKDTKTADQDRCIRYGDEVTIKHGEVYANANMALASNRIMKFGSTTQNFFLRPWVGGGRRNGECIAWDAPVVVAATSNSGNEDTGTCGWYGCRVLKHNGNLHDRLYFTHGKDEPMAFYMRQPTLNYHDRVVIASTSDRDKHRDCGWFGCRVLQLHVGSREMKVNHGGTAPHTFDLAPPVGVSRSASQCIKFGDQVTIKRGGQFANADMALSSTRRMKFGSSARNFFLRPKVGGEGRNGKCILRGEPVVIAATSNSGNEDTGTCGWYGCRVLKHNGNLHDRLYFTHGKDEPMAFYMRPAPRSAHRRLEEDGGANEAGETEREKHEAKEQVEGQRQDPHRRLRGGPAAKLTGASATVELATDLDLVGGAAPEITHHLA